MSLHDECCDSDKSLQNSGDVHLGKVLKLEYDTSNTFHTHEDCTESRQEAFVTEYEVECKDLKIETSDDVLLSDKSCQLFNLPSATISSRTDIAEYVSIEGCSEEQRDFTLLQCPQCDKTLKGGRARIQCMIKHITSDHYPRRRKLIAQLKDSCQSRILRNRRRLRKVM